MGRVNAINIKLKSPQKKIQAGEENKHENYNSTKTVLRLKIIIETM